MNYIYTFAASFYYLVRNSPMSVSVSPTDQRESTKPKFNSVLVTKQL